MTKSFDAFDADRPLMLRCACGQDHAPGEHAGVQTELSNRGRRQGEARRGFDEVASRRRVCGVRHGCELPPKKESEQGTAEPNRNPPGTESAMARGDVLNRHRHCGKRAAKIVASEDESFQNGKRADRLATTPMLSPDFPFPRKA